VARALGSLIKLRHEDALSWDYYPMPLCDILLDLVERDIDGPDALTLSQIAHSIGHDFLNLATLAGKLLWCEAVTPDMSRSTDLVAISVDAESYLVFLRSACDVMALALVQCGVEPRKRGTVPRDSFHRLLNWTKKDPERINYFYESFHFFTQHSDWFMELKDIRDKLVHQGFNLNIYTDRVLLELILMPSGEAELKLLHGGHKQEDFREDKPRFRRYPLISFLKGLTLNVLGLAKQIALAIAKQFECEPSRTHLLNGVYVPALRHLTSYKQPVNRRLLQPAELHSTHKAAWYLLQAGDYLSSLSYGYPDGFCWRFLIRFSEFFKNPPTYISEPEHAGSWALVRWLLVFRDGELSYALSIRDFVLLEAGWLKAVKLDLDKFAADKGAYRAVLVANRTLYPNGSSISEKPFADLIIETDPDVAAEKAFSRLKIDPPLVNNS
jgi:hypothetical protein